MLLRVRGWLVFIDDDKGFAKPGLLDSNIFSPLFDDFFFFEFSFFFCLIFCCCLSSVCVPSPLCHFSLELVTGGRMCSSSKVFYGARYDRLFEFACDGVPCIIDEKTDSNLPPPPPFSCFFLCVCPCCVLLLILHSCEALFLMFLQQL